MTEETWNILGKIDESPAGVTLTFVCGRCKAPLGGGVFMAGKTRAELEQAGFPVPDGPRGVTCACGVHYPDVQIHRHEGKG